MPDLRPRRTVLYLPAANARAIEKARTLPADSLILDLEDAVAPDAKDSARAAAVEAVAAGDWGGREVAIRVNGFGTPWADADFEAVAGSAAHLLVVPKIDGPEQAAEAVARAGGKPVWVLVETPRAILSAAAIAATPGITGLIAGFADLAKDLRLKPGPERFPLFHAMSVIVTAARAQGILAFDGVFTDIRDPAGLEAETAQAVEFGFDGKTCIHPDQLDTVNRLFSPSPEDIAHAQGLIAAHRAAAAEGKGVATFKGKLIEVLHVAEAERTLRIADVIGAMAGLAGKVVEAATD
jgi:citrate lyase beta subunit